MKKRSWTKRVCEGICLFLFFYENKQMAEFIPVRLGYPPSPVVFQVPYFADDRSRALGWAANLIETWDFKIQTRREIPPGRMRYNDRVCKTIEP